MLCNTTLFRVGFQKEISVCEEGSIDTTEEFKPANNSFERKKLCLVQLPYKIVFVLHVEVIESFIVVS